MFRFLTFAVSLLLTGAVAVAQTGEPIRYVVTAPSGASLTLDGTLTLPASPNGPVPVVLAGSVSVPPTATVIVATV